jgi:alginate O-acetyltransferase complex protein AlgI
VIFSTPLFLFVFLPVFLAVYYLLPFRFRSIWILTASYAFYGWWRVDFLALFFAVTLWSFLIGKSIAKATTQQQARQRLIIGIVANLLALGYFRWPISHFMESNLAYRSVFLRF